MKKRLFTLLACAATMLAAYAQQVGDYAYTKEARYKITGENMIPNGDFSEMDAGWTTDSGEALDATVFDTANGYLEVLYKEDGASTVSTLLRKIEVEADQPYYISYRVKFGNTDEVVTTTTSTADKKNYQSIFFNTDGSLEPGTVIATSQEVGADWTQVDYCFTPAESGYIVVHIYGSYVGTCFDDFSVRQATRVVDDRQVNSLIARLNAYLENPLFPNGHSTLESARNALQSFLTPALESNYDRAEQMIATIEKNVISNFLDANTGNLTDYVPNLTLDDVKTTSANQVKAGAWIITDQLKEENPNGKSRWAVKSAEETEAPFEGNYLQNDIPYGSKNKLYEATVHQTLENMPAGKYMFSMKIRGYRCTSKTATTTEIRGMKTFINNDSIECYPVDDVKANTFEVYADLAEGNSMKLGFYLPDSVANHIDLDFTSLRIIGWTQEDVDTYFNGKEFAEARQNLKLSIDSARTHYNNVEMLYGKVRLDSAIVASQYYYDNINVTDSLIDSRTRLHSEIARYISTNSTLTTLRTTIANAESYLADDSFSEADKQPLREAIEAAKAFLAMLTADNHDQEGFTNNDIKAQTALLNTAINALLATKLQADEKYEFLTWAQADNAEYFSTLETGEEAAIITSSNATLYKETAPFAGHDLNGRFAFNEATTRSLSDAHGLQVNFSSKNATTMAILNLSEGDQIDIDWAMGNASHSVMIVSANAKVKLADGSWTEYTKTGKDNANVLPKDNTDGLSGSVRSTLQMTADGTLDFYQGSSNSTIRIYYLGYTAKEHVVEGIQEMTSQTSVSSSQLMYDLQGRRLNQTPAKGLYIWNGKKYFVK